MTKPQVGVVLLPSVGARRIVELITACDVGGVAFVGVGDSQMLWDEAYTLLGAAAARTTQVRLGPFVTNIRTRHETVTARAIRTLDELSSGRAFLGIGYGDSAVRLLGHEPARRADLAAAIGRMRRLAGGDEVETPAGVLRFGTGAGPLPVWWAADGARSLEQAGQLADVVIANGLLLEEHMSFVREHISAGAAASGRDPAAVDVVFNTGISIDDDPQRALDAAKPYLARTLCHDVSAWLPGWTDEHRDDFRRRYDYYRHIDQGHAIAAYVPDHLVRHKAVAGTPEQCAEQLVRLAELGFPTVSLVALGDPTVTVHRLIEDVLPLL